MRYGRDGYISINDSRPVIVMHPIKPAMNGQDVSKFADPQGNEALRRDREGGQPAGRRLRRITCGRSRATSKPVAKLSYSQRFAPWDWYLVTGMYMDDVQAAFYASALRWLAITALLGVLATVAMLLVLRSIKRNLGGDLELAVSAAQRIARGDLTTPVRVEANDTSSLLYALATMQSGLVETVSRVRNGTENINVGASEIAAGNTDLSQRTEQQAAALVETASSMDEMTANVKQNADSATQADALGRTGRGRGDARQQRGRRRGPAR